MSWTFVHLTSRHIFKMEGPHDYEMLVVGRWKSDEKPRAYMPPIKDRVWAWIDQYCEGRVFDVVNRHNTCMDEIIISREEYDEYQLARLRQETLPADVLDRIAALRELAFESKRDAIMFKLKWFR